MKSYQPIKCDLHDGYELACMRKAIHPVAWQTDNGLTEEKLRFLDIEIQESVEYLIAENQQGQERRIRLDLIESKLPY